MAYSDAMMQERVAQILSSLVQIPSVNPMQAGPKAETPGELALAQFVAKEAEALGATVVLDEVEPDRPNVYATFKGTSDFAIGIDVHLDTVGVEHMTDPPFDGRAEDGRIYGRGSVDTKATFAVVFAALEALRADGVDLVPTVHLIGTVGEEIGGFVGAAAFDRWVAKNEIKLDALVVAEPTMCAPVHGHKGALGLDVTVIGVAAHSSKPHLGVDAIAGAARSIVALENELARLLAGPASTPVGPGTVGVNLIKGGVASNIIANSAKFYVGRRVAPGEVPDEIIAQLTELITVASAPAKVEVEVSGDTAFAAFYQDPDTPLIVSLTELTGEGADTASFGTNALRYSQATAKQMVIFGPGSIDVAHQAVEYVEVSQLEKAASVYRSWFEGSNLPTS